MSGLKPCPFCGSIDISPPSVVNRMSEAGGYNHSSGILCNGCKLLVVVDSRRCSNGWATEGYDETNVRCANSWNNRAIDKDELKKHCDCENESV